jgi:hypothetical protein
MQTGRVSLDAFRDSRRAFTADEWIDLLIRTMGYEPSKYGKSEKIWMLCRLIPIVHNRVNMMELAPPGSGKSYVFNNISRHVWLTAAQITPAVLFYNRQSKTPGLLTRYDLLVLDEAQSIRFSDPAETQAQLKGYLEQGVYTRGDCAATAECGLMLLANIDLMQDPSQQYFNGKPAFVAAKRDYIRKLPVVFQESPLLDRFHGILPGWKIPPFEVEQQANGLGLKADYFAEVCHALRSASDIAQNVRAKLRLSGNKRDCTAVERLACGLAKLLLLSPNDPEFEELVIAPAEEMRRLVRTQLNAVDPEGYRPQLQIVRIGSAAKPAETLGRIARYDLLEEIARGGMAVIYKGLDTDSGTIVAIKKVALDANTVDEAALRREIDIYERLKQIPNRNILAVRDVFRQGTTYALVTEFADGGSLWDLVGGNITDQKRTPLDERSVREIALAMLNALSALHENDIVHRDIKPQNVLRCDDTWKLADFGISKLRNNPVTGFTFQGAHTIPWAPPEQIEGAAAHPSADIYAIGRVLCFLLTGMQEKVSVQHLEPHWATILAPCVDVTPEKRPDVDSVRASIEELSF